MRKALLIILFIFIIMLSCTSTKYIEVPTETIKTEYKDNIVKDIIYVKDSSDINIRGDTIYKTKYIYKYIYKIDTIAIYRTDSIPKVIKVESVKEVNKLKNWQIILMVLGGGAIIIIISNVKRFIWKLM